MTPPPIDTPMDTAPHPSTPKRSTSICYMSLADAFLTRLQQEAESRSKRRMEKEGVVVEVVAVQGGCRQGFVQGYLARVYEQGQGTFSKAKTFAKQTIYECERSNQCKGSSSGDPTKTRANGCSAYISFLFEEGATVTACVVRRRLTHTGHDPNNREESRISRIDLKLRFLIETWLQAGLKVSEVMSEVAKWNKTQGYTDHHNRRYFPTRQDIQQIALTSRRLPKVMSGHPRQKPRKYDTLGKDNAVQVLKGEFREWCVFQQSRTTAGPSPRPLVVVVQNSGMRGAMDRLGGEFMCLRSNFEGLRQYGSAVYVVAVSDGGSGAGGALPAAYIVTSDDEPTTFLLAFRELLTHCPAAPRVVMVDQEIQGFAEVLATLLPDTLFLLPWVQVAQEVHRWLQASPAAGKENAGVRRMLLQCLQELRACDTKEAFVASVGQLEGRPGLEGFLAMLWADWLTHPTRWSDFGRAELCGGPAQAAVWERLFLRLHHQFLKGVHTRRTLPDLLKLLTDTITHRKNAVEGLLDMSALVEGSAVERATALVKQGWQQLVTWQGLWVAHVPCHTLLETSYRVNLITLECECPLLTLGGPCVHLCLVLSLAGVRQGASPQQERQRLARAALEQGDYLLEADCCVTFHSGTVCVTELESGTCTCVAAALDTVCVGALLVGLAKEAGHTLALPPIMPLGIKAEEDLAAPQLPVVIQTHTGLPRCLADTHGDLREDQGQDHSLSSKALLEKLYLWSTTKEFTDSEVLHRLLQAAHDTVWPAPLPPSPPAAPQPRQAVSCGSDRLRAVVRTVRRKRRRWERLGLPPPR